MAKYTEFFPDASGSSWATCPQCGTVDSKVNMVYRGGTSHYCQTCDTTNEADYQEMMEIWRAEDAAEQRAYWREVAIEDGTPWTDENGVEHYSHHVSEAPDDDELPF